VTTQKFYMKVSQHKDDYLEIFKQVKSNHQNTITLLSNAFVENNIFDFCDFAINRTVNFRFISTKTNDYKFKKGGQSKSKLYNFLEEGQYFPKRF